MSEERLAPAVISIYLGLLRELSPMMVLRDLQLFTIIAGNFADGTATAEDERILKSLIDKFDKEPPYETNRKVS